MKTVEQRIRREILRKLEAADRLLLQEKWGYPDTFTLGEGWESITCKRCKQTSYNLNDVNNLYCPRCHVFHDDIWPPARQWLDGAPGS